MVSVLVMALFFGYSVTTQAGKVKMAALFMRAATALSREPVKIANQNQSVMLDARIIHPMSFPQAHRNHTTVPADDPGKFLSWRSSGQKTTVPYSGYN